MTYGQGVEAEDSFPKLLERRLRERHSDLLVINGGGVSSDTVGQFESLKEFVEQQMSLSARSGSASFSEMILITITRRLQAGRARFKSFDANRRLA